MAWISPPTERWLKLGGSARLGVLNTPVAAARGVGQRRLQSSNAMSSSRVIAIA